MAVAGVLTHSSLVAAAPASYKGISPDGGIVFFETEDRLVPGDTDSKRDIYERSFDPTVGEGGTFVTRQVSTGPTGGNDAYNAIFEEAGAEGERAFLSTDESLVGADVDHASDVYARDLTTGATVLVSVAAASCNGGPCGNGEVGSTFLGSTLDGDVAFFASGERLAGGDEDAAFDVYARDLTDDTTTLVSEAAPGCVGACGDGPAPSTFEVVSDDGTTAYFTTTESLSSADGDAFQDVYRRDLVGGATSLVSTAGTCPAGLECDAVFRGTNPSASSVFFQTTEQLDPADDDEGASDLYAWTGGSIDLISAADAGCGSCGDEGLPATFAGTSADGRTVLFQIGEPLTATDLDGAVDVYKRDRDAATTTLISVPGTCPLTLCNAIFRATSADGAKVAFQTTERLDGGDGDKAVDLYLRDMEAGTTTLVSAAAPGCAGCGGDDVDAKFGTASPTLVRILFSTAEALAPGDGDEGVDVYERDLSGTPTTSLLSVMGVCPLGGGQSCDSTFEASSDDASRLVFSTVERLGVDDVDSEADLYERADGLTRLVSTGNAVELGPSTPILTATSPASPNPSLEPAILGQSDSGSAIKIYATSDCSGAPVKTGTAAQLTGAGIKLVVAVGSTTTFWATATDGNGDTSACSASGLKYQQAAPLGSGEPPPVDDGGGGAASEGASGGGGTGSRSGSGGGRRVGNAQPVVPQTRITFGPASKTQARRPVFRFTDTTGQNGTEFRCKVDRGRWKGCSSPYRAQRLSPGAHAFSVRGTNSGLSEIRPVARKFRVVGR